MSLYYNLQNRNNPTIYLLLIEVGIVLRIAFITFCLAPSCLSIFYQCDLSLFQCPPPPTPPTHTPSNTSSARRMEFGDTLHRAANSHTMFMTYTTITTTTCFSGAKRALLVIYTPYKKNVRVRRTSVRLWWWWWWWGRF